MSPVKPKVAFLSVRLTVSTRTKFLAKARQHGRPSAVLREIIAAFVEDRLTITPRKESLYVTGK